MYTFNTTLNNRWILRQLYRAGSGSGKKKCRYKTFPSFPFPSSLFLPFLYVPSLSWGFPQQIHLEGLGAAQLADRRFLVHSELKIKLSVIALLPKFSDNQGRIVTVTHIACPATYRYTGIVYLRKEVAVFF